MPQNDKERLGDGFRKSEPAEATRTKAQAYARGGSGLPGCAGLRRKSSGGHKLKNRNKARRPYKTHCVGEPPQPEKYSLAPRPTKPTMWAARTAPLEPDFDAKLSR